MIKQYFYQSLAQLKQQPLIGLISILGTALSIFLIMLVVMMQQVKVAPYAPESNRDRLLYVRFMSLQNVGWGDGSSNGPLSVSTAKACYQSLKSPEAVTIYSAMTLSMPASMRGSASVNIDLRQTDALFWHVFDFAFLAGKPYDQATFEAGIPVAVISQSTARRVFGSVEVVGEEFLLNHAPYRVAGVVRDVSTLADAAHAEVWIPYTSTGLEQDTWSEGHMGKMSVAILAHQRSDFDAIRAECERQLVQHNAQLAEQGYEIIPRNRPYDQETQAVAFSANREPDLAASRRQQAIIILVLLLVPAINLSSMTQSRLRRRLAEIGVRRAFGSTRREMVGQIVMENFVVSLLAGAVGLLLSVAFAYLANDVIFAKSFSSSMNLPTVSASMLLQPSTFAYALGFCFLLNLLSSLLPAWRATRSSIVNALAGKTH